MYQTLLTSLNEQILFITINRPDKLNAINSLVMEELRQVVEEVNQNENIRAALITGAGTKAFVAGADIGEFDGDFRNGKTLSEKGQQVFARIETSSKPFVAAVNGFALGAGCELAMSCHLRLASRNAKFGQPEVNLGLIPGYGGTQRLAQLIGKGRALELLLTGKIIDAATAERYGLVNEVTDDDKLIDRAKELLQVINSKAPAAIASCIAAVNAGFIADGYALEAQRFGECFSTEDMKEGKSAFLEKRKANFTGK